MKIKTISLWQPWATLIAIGAKTLETRSWATKYRGLLAIHAAKRWQAEQQDFLQRGIFQEALAPHGYTLKESLPFGRVVAIVHLKAIYKTEDIVERVPEWDRAFGDFRSGRYAWECAKPYELKEPIPLRGSQGLFEWEAPEGFLGSLPAIYGELAGSGR